MFKIVVALLILCFCGLSHAGPWFVDPILAPTGKVVPLGHAKFRGYGFFTNNIARYNNQAKIVRAPILESIQFNPQLTYGLTESTEAQLVLPYSFVHNLGKKIDHLGDTSIRLGYQALRQKPGTSIPNLRVVISETFPTGRFSASNPLDEGAGFTGIGNYQTSLQFNFEEILQITGEHYSRTRLSLIYLYNHPVSLHGISINGGAATTEGSLTPGNIYSINLSEEITITQQWSAAMEFFYLQQQASSFNGFRGINEKTGKPANVGHLASNGLSLAPALEYAITENLGFVAGVWFTVEGKNTADFYSTVFLLRAFW